MEDALREVVEKLNEVAVLFRQLESTVRPRAGDKFRDLFQAHDRVAATLQAIEQELTGRVGATHTVVPSTPNLLIVPVKNYIKRGVNAFVRFLRKTWAPNLKERHGTDITIERWQGKEPPKEIPANTVVVIVAWQTSPVLENEGFDRFVLNMMKEDVPHVPIILVPGNIELFEPHLIPDGQPGNTRRSLRDRIVVDVDAEKLIQDASTKRALAFLAHAVIMGNK